MKWNGAEPADRTAWDGLHPDDLSGRVMRVGPIRPDPMALPGSYNRIIDDTAIVVVDPAVVTGLARSTRCSSNNRSGRSIAFTAASHHPPG